MSEANKPEYFVDGFMLKHFNVWPLTIDKNNLFEEQKIFIIYLMGLIPSHEDWSIQIDYKTKLQEIKNLKKIDLEKTDIDLAKMQGKDLTELKKERLLQEKEKRIKELNDKFGIKNEVEEIKLPEGIPNKVSSPTRQEKLWDILQLQGKTGKKEAE